ncbi:PD-(D/E)XK nuclease family protein [Leucobacter sp. VD1]|uniref:PD-(D/E)XK nuclease family protein n=1 Tax=Leucobacter sp. VD1 TaxID=3080381 RepID=UPI003016D974
MFSFDPSQQAVLALDPGRHARVLGAAGTGKTAVLIEAFARAISRDGWDEDHALVMAPNRLVASELRGRVERRAGRAIGGTPVRTATSLAFAVLARAAAVEGRPAPRLLTGTAQDEAIAETIERGLSGAARISGLVPEVLQSPAFRAELRELWRIVDDFNLHAADFAAQLRELRGDAGSEALTRLPAPETLERWCDGLDLIAAVAEQLTRERPGELSSSALLRAAAAAVQESGAASDGRSVEPGTFPVPRLLLVDDAQELGEGELALLAACASVGSRVWVFGDPDSATGAFHGERTAVLARLGDELRRRGAASDPEQRAVLGRVHRQGAALRGFVQHLTERVGAAGAGEQRAAGGAAETPGTVEFAVVGSPAEQLGVIAHRLRARHLGLDARTRIDWSEMAVICRSRSEALRVSRALATHQVPTGVAAGGIVLREHQIVRELVRLLQHALGLAPLTGEQVLQLAGGTIGGLDPVAIRRLRGALLMQERRDARTEQRAAGDIGDIVLEAFAHPGDTPLIDSSGGRALRRIGLLAAAAVRVREAGGTARETLWALWEGTRLAERWQTEALDGRGARADEAHRSLDAVMGLFFALQRHEEQDSEQPIGDLLEELLLSAVPEDSLAQRSERAAVTVTTPQGAIGREFSVVAVIGVQDGAWPNLRARGSLLGTASLERWLRGAEAIPPSRKDTMHDELRLFVHSCARARDELLVVAISDDDQHPSPFFGLGRDHRCEGLPSSRLTLRGSVAEMRRRITLNPADTEALRSLVALARESAPGARPEEWYGVLPPSTTAPLFELNDPETIVPVSPSQLERAETCPLDWAVASLGGGTGNLQASLGTLVHHALETAQSPDAEAMLDAVKAEWAKLPFDAEWESERAERLARAMTESLAAYLRSFEASDRRLLGRETPFSIPIDRAVLRGMADRLEAVERPDGETEVTVLDLKTGRTPPSKAAAEAHAQLQAYQLGVARGAFELPENTQMPAHAHSGGARLLYVHPDATKSADYIERVQQPITPEASELLQRRVADIAQIMAAGEFTARVEHHCSDPHQPGDCRLHIIPAVSRA